MDMSKAFRILAASLLPLAGCSLALDFEGLRRGEEETDTGVDPNACTVDSQCDDDIECTVDSCKDYQCYRVPDNSKCNYLEMCSRERGCVPTGKECLVNSDCDDGVDCTVDQCAGGSCRHLPDDTLCVNEENHCIKDRTCQAENGCTTGTVVSCDGAESGPCMTNVCDPASGECVEVRIAGADDDGDGFLDVNCGGNDCADANPKVHPDMSEICDFIDNDCDGLADVKALDGPVTVMTASSLGSPDLASDGTRFALAWQRGTALTSAVYAQILGTGTCLTDPVCNDPSSTPASELVNLTPKGGGESAGSDPSIGFGGGEFAVAWVASQEVSGPRLIVFGIKRPGEGPALELWPQARQISALSAVSVSRAGLATTADGSGWVAVWQAAFADGGALLEFTDSQMLQKEKSPLQVSLGQGSAVESVSVALLDQTGAIVAYSLRDASEGSDLEVYEARMDLSGETWELRPGWPVLVSEASEAQTDPSNQPTVTATGPTSWVTAFSDIRVPTAGDPENETDIRAVKDGAKEVISLFQDSVFSQLNPGIAGRQGSYGLSYVQDVFSGQTLDFRMLDSSLNRYDKQGGRLVHLEGGELVSSRLISYNSGFALAWVESPEKGDAHLKFMTFQGCTPAEE